MQGTIKILLTVLNKRKWLSHSCGYNNTGRFCFLLGIKLI